MASTDDLIASLARDAHPRNAAPAPVQLLWRWLVVAAIYCVGALLIMGVREDIAVRLMSPMYVLELLLLLAMIVTTGLCAMALSFPDLYQQRKLATAPAAPAALFVLLLLGGWMFDTSKPTYANGAECLLCITLLSLLPAAWLLRTLRKQASVHYRAAGGVALLAAWSLGAFVLRLSEQVDVVEHMVVWHYLPMLGFGLIGVWVGKRLLKW